MQREAKTTNDGDDKRKKKNGQETHALPRQASPQTQPQAAAAAAASKVV